MVYEILIEIKFIPNFWALAQSSVMLQKPAVRDKLLVKILILDKYEFKCQVILHNKSTLELKVLGFGI